jgi:hypothetical protein
MDKIASELLVERLADWGVDTVFGLPDDHPLTGGLGLLGTKPSEAVVHECDTLLMVGTNFPYTAHLPEPGHHGLRAPLCDRRPVGPPGPPVRRLHRRRRPGHAHGRAGHGRPLPAPHHRGRQQQRLPEPDRMGAGGARLPRQAKGFAEAFLRGQPDKLAVAKTLIKDQVDKLRS